MIRSLASTATVDRHDRGTTVRVTLDVPGRDDPPAPAGAPAEWDVRPGTGHLADESPDARRLALRGDLDLIAVTALRPEVFAQVTATPSAAGGVRRLVLDLTDVTFLASAGLRLLVEVAELAAGHGWTVRLRYPAGGLVERVLEVSGLSHLPRTGHPGSTPTS